MIRPKGINMRLVFNFQVSPGQCHVCGSSKSGKIIDTDRDDLSRVKRYHVYLCELCVTAAYKMLEPTKTLVEATKIAELEGENVALTDEVLRLRTERDAWDTRIAQALVTNADA